MFDRVKLRGENDPDLIDKQIPKQLIEHMKPGTRKSFTTPRNEKGVIGEIGDAYVCVTDRNHTVSFSLPKISQGHNLRCVSRQQAIENVTQLGDSLGVNLMQAQVVTFEFGDTLFMEHPVGTYLDLFGQVIDCRLTSITSRKGARTWQSEQVTNGHKSQLQIYDKRAQMGRKDMLKQSDFDEWQHFLRAELKVLNGVYHYLSDNGFFSPSRVTMQWLLSEAPYQELVRLWEKALLEMPVKVTRSPKLLPEGVRSPLDFKNFLASAYIHEHGLATIMHLVNQLDKDTDRPSDVRKMMRGLSARPACVGVDTLIQEFHSKVRSRCLEHQ